MSNVTHLLTQPLYSNNLSIQDEGAGDLHSYLGTDEIGDNLTPEEFRQRLVSVQALLRSNSLPQLGDLTHPTQDSLIQTLKA